MNTNKLFDPNENPLENFVTDGGFTKIFRTIAVVGDSLSSGEFESLNEKGEVGYHDMYEYSWGQYIARTCGCKVYNFSRGGMTAKWYMDSYADENDFWNKDKACQAYIFAMGCNDILNRKQPIGTIDDIKDDYKDTPDTFIGCFGAIVKRLKEIQPDAKFFFMTLPRMGGKTREAQNELIDQHADALYKMADHFSNSYVLDIRKYGPVYDDAFHDQFFMSGHLNAMGYIFTATMTMSYIDYIIRHNMEDFKLVPFMGTPWTNVNVNKK